MYMYYCIIKYYIPAAWSADGLGADARADRTWSRGVWNNFK